MHRMTSTRFLVIILLFGAPAWAAAEDEWRFEIGPRANVLLGNGKPANDILGFGVVGRYKLNNGWFIGAAVDSYEYDFERPAKVLGIPTDPDADVIDANGDYTALSGSIGRLYNETNRGFDWYWTLGLGFASPNVDDVSGPTEAGGTFDITFDVGSEIHVMGALGTSYNFSNKWSVGFTARLEHQFLDMTMTDTVSGNTTKLDSQTAMGASIGFNYRF